MKKTLSFLAAAAITVGLLGPAAAKPLTVIEDASGDADVATGAGASIPAGLDIVAGTIEKKGKDLIFSVEHADMPPTGSLPEGARFLWAFNVGDKGYRWTFKSADIGKPDVVAGQTDERVGRVDAQGHFRLEADCSATPVGSVSMINCPVVGYYEGTIDAAAKTLSVAIPMKDLKAKTGTKITPGAGENTQICPVCWVSHVAERSLNSTIIDSAAMTKTFTVPKK